jgi:hypothetical protein
MATGATNQAYGSTMLLTLLTDSFGMAYGCNASQPHRLTIPLAHDSAGSI